MNSVTKVCVSACAAAMLAAGAPAAAQTDWPAKPVTLIVPSAAGGAADMTARTFAQFLGARTGQSILVENRPGAGGIIGTAAAKGAPADGYTFLLSTNSTHAANQFLYKSLPYDPQADFRQIGMFGTFGSVAVVSAESPYESLDALIQAARDKPGQVFFGYYSSSSQVPSELLKASADIEIQGAPYKNITQIITDLRGGQIDFAFIDYLTAMGQLDGKSLRPLAVTGAERHPNLPEVPTMSTWYPELVVLGWMGLSAPAGVPDAVVDKLNAYMGEALAHEATDARLRRLGLQPRAMDVATFDQYVKDDAGRWRAWVELAGIQPQ